MKILINGKETEVKDDVNVSMLIIEQKVKMPEMVSVAINGNIINRAEYETTILKPNDAVEFLYFMGGGFFKEQIK